MKSGLLSIAVVSFVALPFATLAGRAETRGVTAEDYFAFQNIGDAHLSPDGKQVAYVLTTVDQKRNRRDNGIWVVATDGKSAPRRLTAEGVNSTVPRWSPDGTRVAFLSTRGTAAAGETEALGPQIYILHLDGGEAQALTHLKNGAGVFQWSPDGKRFVVVSRTGPSDNVAPAARKSDVRHYSHISYKFNDTGWFDDKRSHLWVVEAATGAARQITSGEDWNDTDPQWSPDGTRLAFVSDRTGLEFDDGRNKDVWVIAADGGSSLAKISDHNFDDTQPRWSPDGKVIAFAGQTQRRQFPKLYIASAAGGGKSSQAVDDFDLIPTDLHWGPGARELRFETGVKGQMHIFRVDLDTRKVSPVTSGERGVRGFDASKEAGVMTYLANDFQHLDDLYAAALDGSGERQLTHLNGALWAGLEVAGVERVPYKSTDGWDIDGFFVKPVGWQAGKKYPMVLSVHGGPAGQYGVDWYHEFQVYAGKGWAVFFCNPRGSTGYGQKFERGIVNNWGGMDYQDVMAGVDAALKKYPWVDTERLGVTGGSYGGFMTNWILGHTTKFKAAVTLRSVANFISDDGTRDGAYGHEEDFKGFLFDQFDQYWNASPLKYAKNVKTPTLILHSDNDYRVPLEQGEQWFRALKHYGVTTELVIFPRENHNLTRTGEPKHLVESLDWQCYWFDKFLNGNENAKPPDL
ncbi:MAG TPA: S9 family peptidase [Candidatus Acidoferrales bacterium]|nr:S9 family peptidase [Candidatus Acidoferrales bacterium]